MSRSTKNDSVSTIPQQDKDHLKTLFGEFLAHKEYREMMNPGWLRESEIMITLCAAYGKFDFSVVLEHFSDLMSAVKFMRMSKEFMKWEDFMIHYAAYWLLDCPLLNLAVGASNDFRLMKEGLDRLLFSSYYSPLGKKEKILNPAGLPAPVQKAFDKEDLPNLFKKMEAEKQAEKLIADVTYTALLQEKWEVFAAINTRYDLSQYVDMEKIFDFWCRELLPNARHNDLGSQKAFDFPGQWKEPEKYPLHQMMIEYGRERCVPALYRQGFLLPEVIEYLWERGISFASPFNQLYGWEKVNFSAFAECFGDLADKIPLIPVPKYPQRGEMIFRQNVKSAAYFNEYSTSHPRKASMSKPIPIKTKKGELTPEQKKRLANDEAAGIEFSENKKILKRYTSCLGEKDDWIENGYAVPDFVTAIAAGAFSDIDGLQVKTIILPEGLTKIGPRAFEYVQIENVTFPSSLKTIGEEAFCSSELKELHLLEGIVKIEEAAFSCCDNLKAVILPDSLTELGRDTFLNCTNLTEVRLPANLRVIPSDAFAGCSNLESIVIPDGVKEIKIAAFERCPKLRQVDVPKGIKIDKVAFAGSSPELKITYREPKKR